MSIPDLSTLTEKELLEALKKKKKEKESDRIAYKELVEETIPEVIHHLIKTSQ